MARSTSPQKGTRDLALDATRAIAIIAVVAGHAMMASTPTRGAEAVGTALAAVYLFNVQAFAFVSGYLAVRFSLRSRIETLLIPLLSWVLVYAIAGGRGALNTLEGVAVGVLTGGSNLWFLWALFVGLVLLGVSGKMRRVLLGLSLVWGVAWVYVPPTLGVRYVGYILPFIMVGRELRAYEDEHGRLPNALLVVAGVASVVLFALLAMVRTLLTEPSTAQNVLVGCLVLLTSLTACGGLLGLSRVLRGAWRDGLAAVGSMSIGIYGFNSLLLLMFPSLFASVSVLELVIKFAVLLGASIALTWLVSRSHWLTRLLLGGRPPRYLRTR